MAKKKEVKKTRFYNCLDRGEDPKGPHMVAVVFKSSEGLGGVPGEGAAQGDRRARG